MALKRALVVDDSLLARIALKKQLEKHGLSVELADSGEVALEFLKHEMVDVVFMDHIMPGMDGLEAVSAIKANPRTATIPVMMYTSKEGEVYVSQARALGAVDVLPKQVQSGVLFGMLLKLGLVRDRRNSADAAANDASARAAHDAASTDDDQQPAGMPMPALLSRIIEDQAGALRSDILSSHRSFAKRVAKEVYEEQKADHAATFGARQDRAGWPIAAGALLVAVLLLGIFFVQMRAERDGLRADRDRLAASVESSQMLSTELAVAAKNAESVDDASGNAAFQRVLGPLTWAINQAGAVPFDERPLNAARTEQLGQLLDQLRAADFRGTVRVETHLGEFCMVSDAAGVYSLADPEAPLTACAFIGHPLDDSTLLGDRQTEAFRTFLSESPLINGSGITLEFIAQDRVGSMPRLAYPVNAETAGDWNRVAAQNNRVEYTLLPDDAG